MNCARALSSRLGIAAALALALAACSGSSPFPLYTVSGTVRGLEGGPAVLALNDGARVTVYQDGAFTFPARLPVGATYTVTLLGFPRRLVPSTSGLSGTVAGNVDDVSISFEPGFLVGGTVTGLDGTARLRLDGSDPSQELEIDADGRFEFTLALRDGATFNANLVRPPASQRGQVSRGVGRIAGADITTIELRFVEKEWRHPTSFAAAINPGDTETRAPRVAAAANGEAIIAWVQSDGQHLQVFVSEYRGGVWKHPAALTDNISPDGADVREASVAMAPDGDAVVAWRQLDGLDDHVFVSHRRDGVWTHPADLQDHVSRSGGAVVDDPAVAVGGNGDCVVTWPQRSASGVAIYLSEFRMGTWTHPSGLTDFVSPAGGDAARPRVALDAEGNALLAWYQHDGWYDRVLVSEHRQGAWRHPGSVADFVNLDNTDAFDPTPCFDGRGDAVLMWLQSDGTVPQVYLAELRAGAWTWPGGIGDHVSPAGASAFEPRLDCNAAGQVSLVWQQSRLYVMHSAYRNGAWKHPGSVAEHVNPGPTPAERPDNAIDHDGNELLVWRQGSPEQIYFAEQRRGVWKRPILGQTLNVGGGAADNPQVVVDGRGDAIIVWVEADASHQRVMLSEYR